MTLNSPAAAWACVSLPQNIHAFRPTTTFSASRSARVLSAPPDPNGEFRAQVTPGRIEVRVQDTQQGSAQEDNGAVAGGESRRVIVRLHPEGRASLSGHVTLTEGKPGEGVIVLARGARGVGRVPRSREVLSR